MKRVLILGGTGMAGHQCWLAWRDRFDTRVAMRALLPDLPQRDWYDPARVSDGVDLTREDAVRRLLHHVRPEVVVNTAGLVKQRANGDDPEALIAVNALLPHRLAKLCAAVDARLIHLSTDCVFSGARGDYRETDRPDPVDRYGWSKLLGEPDPDRALTVRTSIVGRELNATQGLLEWLLAQRGGVAGYRNARFSGVTTIELARVLAALIEEHPGLTGLWHVAGPAIAKYDLLVKLRDRFALDLEIEPRDEPRIDRSLDDTRFRRVTGLAKPDWDAMIEELMQDSAWRGKKRVD